MDRLRSSLVGESSPIVAVQRWEAEQQADADREGLLVRATDDEEIPENRKKYQAIPLDSDDVDGIRRASIKSAWRGGIIQRVIGQVPAVALIGMFHLMVGIPFGVSYFPVGWRSNYSSEGGEEDDGTGVHGPFPVPGKEAMGIRMFLFSTIIAQIVYTFTSKFDNPIGLQMVENVPFCHELSKIVIRHQGYGIESLSTLFFMFGFASVVVGAVFYLLGKFQLGRVIYYFPTHVLVGAIGGIGIFIAKTGIEVTMDEVFEAQALLVHFRLLSVVVVFEVVLRVLQRITLDVNGKPKYTLLSPVYFCMITPIFYLGLWVLGGKVAEAQDAGYFFPPLDDACEGECSSSIFNKDLFDIWRFVNIRTVSWSAVFDSIPTLVALALFSLIHVPINLPAFAISTDTEVDMNNELMAHGYSNFIAGIFFGLQNVSALSTTRSSVPRRFGC